MSKTKLLAGTLVGTALLGMAFVGFVMAETSSHSALTGKVSSQAEGAMEGVLVGAKKIGLHDHHLGGERRPGPVQLPARPNGTGQIRDQHARRGIRAAEDFRRRDGATGPAGFAAQQGHQHLEARHAALQRGVAHERARDTREEKAALGGCVNCHTLQRVLFSRFNADEMVPVVQRMAMHTNNSSPMHPWMRPPRGPRAAPTARQIATAKYLSSINLSAADTFEFPLKTLPRPKGKATQVIYTTYDLPRPDAAPHDAAVDAQGNVWYSDFTSQFIGKLDPKTGKVVEYPVPLNRTGTIAQGGLQIAFDKEGRVYYGNMSQMQIVRFDPKTEKMETFKASGTGLRRLGMAI